jgi:hypothetical protein
LKEVAGRLVQRGGALFSFGLEAIEPNGCRQKSLPEAGHEIGIQHRIDTDDAHGLDHRLGNEQTVERVTVVQRQGRQDGCVLHRDGQDVKWFLAI